MSEPDATTDRQNYRRWQMMARAVGRFVPLRTGSDGLGNWYRAGGDCECSRCGLPYYDHPVCADGQIVTLCNGDQVKL